MEETSAAILVRLFWLGKKRPLSAGLQSCYVDSQFLRGCYLQINAAPSVGPVLPLQTKNRLHVTTCWRQCLGGRRAIGG